MSFSWATFGLKFFYLSIPYVSFCARPWGWLLPLLSLRKATWAGAAHLCCAFFSMGSVFLSSEKAVCFGQMDTPGLSRKYYLGFGIRIMGWLRNDEFDKYALTYIFSPKRNSTLSYPGLHLSLPELRRIWPSGFSSRFVGLSFETQGAAINFLLLSDKPRYAS